MNALNSTLLPLPRYHSVLSHDVPSIAAPILHKPEWLAELPSGWWVQCSRCCTKHSHALIFTDTLYIAIRDISSSTINYMQLMLCKEANLLTTILNPAVLACYVMLSTTAHIVQRRNLRNCKTSLGPGVAGVCAVSGSCSHSQGNSSMRVR